MTKRRRSPRTRPSRAATPRKRLKLTPQERHLLTRFHTLPKEGRDAVLVVLDCIAGHA